MNSQTRRDLRLGLIALALSGLLFTVATVVRGPIELNTESLIRSAASPNWGPAWAMGVVGSVLMIYGFLGLYRYLTYQADNWIAFLAGALSTTAIALFIGPAYFMAVYAPVIGQQFLQGNETVTAVFDARFSSAIGRAGLVVSAVGYILGPILFAVAIWRDGRLPKRAGVLFALSFAMTAYPVFFAAELLGGVLLLISAALMAWKGWQETGAGAA